MHEESVAQGAGAAARGGGLCVASRARAHARKPVAGTKRVYLRLLRLLAGPNARLSSSSSPTMSASVRCLLVCGGGVGCADGGLGGIVTGSQRRPSISA